MRGLYGVPAPQPVKITLQLDSRAASRVSQAQKIASANQRKVCLDSLKRGEAPQFHIQSAICYSSEATDSPLMTVTRKEYCSAAAELHHDGLAQSERASPAKKKKKKNDSVATKDVTLALEGLRKLL